MKQPASNAGTLPTASLPDTLWFLLFHIVPNYLQGLFTRNRFWVHVFQTLHPDPLSVRFLSRLRSKYDAPGIFLKLGRTPTLLVFDVEGVKHILKHSPAVFAEPTAKRRGMSRFQPDAVTISHGPAWVLRRPFNEAVLASGKSHPLASVFAGIVREEVLRLTSTLPKKLRWCHFERLFERIMLGVIFGRSARDDQYLVRTLHKLMQNANRAAVCPPKRQLLSEFQSAIRGYVNHPEAQSLTALCAAAPSSTATRIESQIPHWMFAMGETLAINCVRALCLLAADSDVRARAFDEIRAADPERSSSDCSRTMPLLTGVLQEAMRLWPTTQFITRCALTDADVCGHRIRRGTVIMIVNGWFHRAAESYDKGDQFVPEFWVSNDTDPRFNHLSNSTQVCAGRDLALFLGTEVLACIVSSTKLTAIRPRPDLHTLPHAFNQYRVCFIGETQRDGGST